MRDVRKIGVFGHYGNKNLGDESIILAVIQSIKKRIPDIEIVGFSINPEDTTERYQVDSYPIRQSYRPVAVNQNITHQSPDNNNSENIGSNLRLNLLSRLKNVLKKTPVLGIMLKAILALFSSLKKIRSEVVFCYASYQRLRHLDLLVVAGSNQFLDNFGGPFGFPYTLLKWSFLATLARTKVYYVSVGAGPISQSLSKRFIRWALHFADYVSLRDKSSQNLLLNLGYKGESSVYPDLAHSLDIRDVVTSELPFNAPDKGLPVIGINPMPLYDSRYWCEKDDGKYSAYLNKMIEFSSKLLDNGFPVFYFSTMERDNDVIADILKGLSQKRQTEMDPSKYVLNSNTVEQLMANISAADITVATRFHGTVLSLLSGKPMLGVCYYRKAKDLLAEMGQAEYAVDLDTFSANDLWSKFEVLVENRDREQEKISQTNSLYLERLNSQYDDLFGSVSDIGS